MGFYERVTALRKEKGLTQKEVQESLQLNKNAFGNWKKGIIPVLSTLKLIADFFDVSVEYLRCETDERKPPIDLNKAGFETFPYVETPVRPIYGTVSAGTGVIADQIVLGYERVEPQYANDRYFWLQVKGDSMSPVFTDGDLLLIQKSDTLESGTISAVLVDGDEGLVKQVHKSGDTVTLLSFNPAYPPRVFSGEESNRVRSVGRVIEQRRKFLQ